MSFLRRAGARPPETPDAEASLAPPATAPTANEAGQLIAELRDAARVAGLHQDDPMMPLLTAFAHAVRFLDARTAASDHVATESSARITAAIAESRLAAEAEARRFHAELARTEADTIQRIATAIATSADIVLRRRVDVFARNTGLLAAALLVSGIMVALAGGYWWGRNDAYAGFQATETDLRAAFVHGPDAARHWRDLMNWNDIGHSLGLCAGQVRFQGGRMACDVPLWIEPPHPAPTGQ